MTLDPALRREVEARLEFYRELGVYDFYRRARDSAEQAATIATLAPELVDAVPIAAPSLSETASLVPAEAEAFPILGSEAEPNQDRHAALAAIRALIGDCTRCKLSLHRNTIVFGTGDPHARLMFVGEGPGADEDAQGVPFVGRAGQLLNNMITAMGLTREAVYIANIVKCRPPQNRVPEPDEAQTCMQFLWQQIDVVKPEVIVALGSTAATYLLGGKSSLSALRGRLHACRETKLIVTYHPAFLLRDPRQKKEAWKDLQMAMLELGLAPQATRAPHA